MPCPNCGAPDDELEYTEQGGPIVFSVAEYQDGEFDVVSPGRPADPLIKDIKEISWNKHS